MTSRAPERAPAVSEPATPATEQGELTADLRSGTGAVPPAERGSSRPARAVALTVLLGLLLTGVSAWAAHRTDESTEERLLETQTKQAAMVLSAAIGVIQQPLTTALQVQAAAGPDGDPLVFRRAFAANVGDDALFVSASLWHNDGGTMTRQAAIGVAPGMDPRGPEIKEFLRRALESESSVVERVPVGSGSGSRGRSPTPPPGSW